VDAVVRLLPGVLGDADSTREESFGKHTPADLPSDEAASAGRLSALLEYPQYTRPRVFRGLEVPEVLLSGDHGKIREWRAEQARRRTAERRPDLLSS
jgi:tRNA (guanine37-N1)-methyltransferase